MNHILTERWSQTLTLNRLIDDLCRGVGGLLLIEGQCGTGRTELLFELARLACGRQLTVCTARSSVLESEFPYGVLRQLLEPELPALDPDLPVDLHLLDGVLRRIRRLARQAPVILAVDDLNFCDAASLQALAYVARRLQGLPVLIAVTRRAGEPDTAPLVTAGLRGAGVWTVLRCAALSVAGTQELADRTLGPTPAPLVLGIHELTGGNPLLLATLLEGRLLTAATDVAAQQSPGELDRVVGRAVRARLAHLPACVLRVAETVALLGGRQDRALVAQAAGVSESELATVLDMLCGMGLLTASEPWTFVHPVVGGALHRMPASIDPQEVHGRISRTLHERNAPPDAIAHHLLRSQPADTEWAPQVLRAAAAEAVRARRLDEARELLLRALGEPVEGPLREELQTDLDHIELITDPLRLAQRLRPGLSAARSPERQVAAALTCAQALVRVNRAEEAGEVIAQCRARLLEHPPAQSRDGLVHRLDAGAVLVARLGRATSTLEPELLAGVAAGQAGDDFLVTAVHTARAAARGEATAKNAVSRIRRLLADGARGCQDWTALLLALLTLLWADELGLVDRWCSTVLAAPLEAGGLLTAVVALVARAGARFEAGRLRDAEQDARHALEFLGDPGYTDPLQALVLVPLVATLVETGQAEEASVLLESRGYSGTLPEVWPYPLLAAMRARVRAAQGDFHGAAEDLTRSGRQLEEWGVTNPAVLRWRSETALMWNKLGDTEEAGRLAEEELRAAYLWGSPRTVAVALRAQGLVLQGPEGESALKRAVEILEPSDTQLELAYTLTALGVVQCRGNAKREARETLKRALRLAQRIGAATLSERVLSELLTAGALPRRSDQFGTGALTGSERRVAALAATGCTNGSIARELFVTRRTVETHLTRAYRKLGIRGRAELGRALQA
ncbi:AAA ATPase-like protein [Streptomyces sp. 846.5]|nr:LuxR family transcriptional regulator [Streptomyces sp. 846.5]TDU02191.1 AAA ATPase-like protein [Streptomyces sp. 846.5]